MQAQATLATVEASRKLVWLDDFADAALKTAARLWFLAAAAGQLVFVSYILSFYGGAAMRGDLAAWNKFMARGYLPGDRLGNFAVGLHLLLGAMLFAGGAVQMVPQIRRSAPAIHRWNGRVYLLASFAISAAGLYMMWIRGSAGGALVHLGISLNALLIVVCAAFALRYALVRRFELHRRWALRLFVVMSGFWFFRVGVMLWMFVNHGSAVIDPQTFHSPFVAFLPFAQLPLGVLELYLRAEDHAGSRGRLAMAGGLVALTFAMGVGIYAAAAGMWLAQ